MTVKATVKTSQYKICEVKKQADLSQFKSIRVDPSLSESIQVYLKPIASRLRVDCESVVSRLRVDCESITSRLRVNYESIASRFNILMMCHLFDDMSSF